MHRQSGRLNIKYVESAVLPLDSPNRSAGILYIIYARLPGAPHHRRSPGSLRHLIPVVERCRKAIGFECCSIGSDDVRSLFFGTAGYFPWCLVYLRCLKPVVYNSGRFQQGPEKCESTILVSCRYSRLYQHSSGAVWESRWPSWAVRPNEPYVEPCFGIGLSLSLICQPISEDIKQHNRTVHIDLVVAGTSPAAHWGAAKREADQLIVSEVGFSVVCHVHSQRAREC